MHKPTDFVDLQTMHYIIRNISVHSAEKGHFEFAAQALLPCYMFPPTYRNSWLSLDFSDFGHLCWIREPLAVTPSPAAYSNRSWQKEYVLTKLEACGNPVCARCNARRRCSAIGRRSLPSWLPSWLHSTCRCLQNDFIF